jgi:hypothetical protein
LWGSDTAKNLVGTEGRIVARFAVEDVVEVLRLRDLGLISTPPISTGT